MNSNRSLYKLLRVIFPEVLMEYFEITGWQDGVDKIDICLDEKNYMERFDYQKGRADNVRNFREGAIERADNIIHTVFLLPLPKLKNP